MFGVFAIDEILCYRGTRFPGSRTLCHPVVMFLEVIQQVVCIDLLGHWQQKMHIFKNKAGLGHRLSD